MLTLDHIGIAVEDLEKAIALYENLLDSYPVHREFVESQQVEVAFFRTGSSHIELIAPTHQDSAIAQFLKRKGPGMHHVAYLVDDLEESMQEMEKKGFKLIDKRPRLGAQNKLICFIHPKSTQSVLIELCQYQVH